MGSTEHKPPANVKDCRLAEVLQYMCDLEQSSSGQPRVVCSPIPRIFKLCPNQPAVEVTRVVHVDPKSGEVDFQEPAGSIRGKPWEEIVRYTTSSNAGE
ncbi:hypothetical protein BKA70DRAFT_1102380 [Coprinopsis sp. MPI-PUGE-AT-0042]|nr:hypothetical protein BKA70DRAFT_1102380 [Coprinopsis sp. MPI-PUGE-AT-0042]